MKREFVPFALLLVGAMLAVVFAPDDFGLTNGSVLRERILLCGLVFFVPLFRAGAGRWPKLAAQICLLLVVAFQTAVMWEYALRVDTEARRYLEVGQIVRPGERIASVSIVERSLRFHSVAVPQMGNFLGFREDVVVWDNYEIGHYLFPVVAREPETKRFAFDLTTSNALYPDQPQQDFAGELADFERCLNDNHQRIDLLLFWGRDARIEDVIGRWFEPEPVFDNGSLRAYRRVKR